MKIKFTKCPECNSSLFKNIYVCQHSFKRMLTKNNNIIIFHLTHETNISYQIDLSTRKLNKICFTYFKKYFISDFDPTNGLVDIDSLANKIKLFS